MSNIIIINITIRDRLHEFISPSKSIDELIWDIIEEKEIYNFSEDPELFKKTNCKIEIIKQPDLLLWYVNTGIKGYDTYDSAIIAGYTRLQVYNIIASNLGGKYVDSSIETIGIAEETLEIGIVLSSFNPG